MRKRKQRLTESFLAVDMMAVAVAWLAAYYARFHSTLVISLFPPYKGVPEVRDYAELLPLLLIVSAITFALQGLYRLRRPLSLVDDSLRTLAAFIVTAALTLGVTLYIRIYFRYAPEVAASAEYSQGVFVLFVVFGAPLVIAGRRLLLAWFERSWARGENAVRILVAGTSDLGKAVARKLGAQHRLGFNVVGFLSESAPEGAEIDGRTVLGGLDRANEVIASRSIDAVYVALPVDRHADMVDLVKNLNNQFVDVRIVPDLLQCLTLRAGIEDLDGIPIVSLNETPMQGPAAMVKRLMDIAGALALLVLLTFILPVLPAIVIAIALKGGKGPILYTQERMTVDGRRFFVYKFRTMVEDAEAATGPVWAVDGDPRRTDLGAFLRKYNLDEWPQLLNILKGDMSLVGPRPERPSFVHEFKNHIPNYMLRHRVRSGLTGWAQVHGWRGNSSLEKRIEFDLYYIENWSLYLDIKILVLTLFRGFGQTHAY
ncbi:MAG: undecaprenyl-phosphate glucose phosphotransferase [Vicinamibacteria bacterium]|nr:undecaprenyl-phosphate glucose phosphotransferase [Vicinamibacteria bacterium]